MHELKQNWSEWFKYKYRNKSGTSTSGIETNAVKVDALEKGNHKCSENVEKWKARKNSAIGEMLKYGCGLLTEWLCECA